MSEQNICLDLETNNAISKAQFEALQNEVYKLRVTNAQLRDLAEDIADFSPFTMLTPLQFDRLYCKAKSLLK